METISRVVFIFVMIGFLLAMTIAAFLSESEAQDLQIVHIEPRAGQPGITRAEANQLVAQMKYRYQYEARRYFRTVYFISMNEMSTHLTLATRNSRLNDYKRYAYQALGKRSRTIFIVPPVVEAGQWWITGVASGGCSRSGVAYAAAMSKNAQGQPRMIESQQALMHEIGHLLGADHGTGIMDSNIAAIHNPVTFSSGSLRQFSVCKQ